MMEFGGRANERMEARAGAGAKKRKNCVGVWEFGRCGACNR